MTFFSLVNTPEWNSVDFRHKFICVTSSAPLDALNIYWFFKIIKTILRHIHYSSPAKTSSSNSSASSLSSEEMNLLKNKLLDNESLTSRIEQQSLLEKNE
jgi:hypothetical protein